MSQTSTEGSWSITAPKGTLVTTDNAMKHTHSVTVQDSLPIGSIVKYIGSDVPNGWLQCNGQSVSQSTYPLLYAKTTVLPNLTSSPTVTIYGRGETHSSGGSAKSSYYSDSTTKCTITLTIGAPGGYTNTAQFCWYDTSTKIDSIKIFVDSLTITKNSGTRQQTVGVAIGPCDSSLGSGGHDTDNSGNDVDTNGGMVTSNIYSQKIYTFDLSSSLRYFGFGFCNSNGTGGVHNGYTVTIIVSKVMVKISGIWYSSSFISGKSLNVSSGYNSNSDGNISENLMTFYLPYKSICKAK